MKWLAAPLAGVLLALGIPRDASSARAPAPVETRTYKFKATIKDNAGVTPLKVGESLTGQFTYDLRSEAIRKDKKGEHWAHRKSKRNALVFEYGDLRFVGTGEILMWVNSFPDFETFGLMAPDLILPKGWEMDHKQPSQTYSILFQNNPPRKVIDGIAIPSKLSLDDFKTVREVRFVFAHGVSFPGGAVKERADLRAVVESLEEVQGKN
jgi:hypothetical protein